MKERIRPPKEMEREVLDRLTKDEGPNEIKVFDTKQKAMMFAAAIGFALHRKDVEGTELDQGGEGIRLDVFRDADDIGFIAALAVTTHGDLSVVGDAQHDDRIDLFQRYALLGLREMKRVCYDEKPEYPILGLLKLLDQIDRPDAGDLPGLDGLI